ncbi:hypothetical protein [Prochlorococcus marinus]|nr:hypothetical protein [Prochlorococcus marinus]
MNLFPFRLGYINEKLWERAFKGRCSMGNYFWSTFFAGSFQLL